MDFVDASIRFLNGVPLAGLLLVVTLGFLLGRATWRGLSLGPAGGTLAVALCFGELGLTFRELYGSDNPKLTVGLFGFALFIYSVGFEAGPRFLRSILGGPGWRFVLVGVIVNVIAVALAIGLGKLFGLGDSVTAGLLSGALTSAPTYAAATEVCTSHTALSVSFAVTYPIGLVGVMILIQALPRLMRDDLTEGTGRAEEDDTRQLARDPEQSRFFRVESDEIAGKSLVELDLTHRTGCYITRVHRGEEIFVPEASTRLAAGDRLLVKGRLDELRRFARIVGEEIDDADLRANSQSFRRIHVFAPRAVGQTLAELDLPRRHHCLVTLVRRGDVTIEPAGEVCIERGDCLEVVGDRHALRAVAAELGRFERPTHETDIAVYAGGILLGVLVARLHFASFGLDFRVGLAGGLLFAGVLLGRFRRIGPFSAHVPLAARQLVRDLGILLFVAETGVKAGESTLDVMSGVLWPTLAAGAVTTFVPVVLSILAARYILRMRAVDAWGSVCGAMTSSAALVALRRAADSDDPAISYAASYAVASVLVTVAGQVVVYVMT